MKKASDPSKRLIERLQPEAERLLVAQFSDIEVEIKLTQGGVTVGTARRAIKLAWARWDTKNPETLRRRRERHLDTLRAVFRAAMAAGHFNPAIRALGQIAEIEGFYAPTQLELEAKQAIAEPALTGAEKRARLDRMLAERGMRLVPAGPDVLSLPESGTSSPRNGSNGSTEH